MKLCIKCDEKNKRIMELERLLRNMSESADAVRRRIASNVIHFPAGIRGGREIDSTAVSSGRIVNFTR